MADGDSRVEQQQQAAIEAERLRYLGFIQAATLRAIICFSNIYEFAKDKSGPLKPSVESLEGTVKNVVGPVYVKYHGVPIEFLKFMDRKMDESVTKLDSHVPVKVKRVSEQAVSVAKRAPETARSVATEVQRAGLTNTAKNLYSVYEPTAKEAYVKYEPVVEKYAVSAWDSLNRLPLFPQMAQLVVPTAAYCSEKYNETVMTTSGKGYRVASYLPLVPTERISKVFGAERGVESPAVVAGGD